MIGDDEGGGRGGRGGRHDSAMTRTMMTMARNTLTTTTISSSHSTFVPQYLETEIDGERIGLTLWDSEGLDKTIIDLQLREMNSFLESKFEETFIEEMKVIRAPGVQETHIHCVFLLLDPARLDATIASAVQGRGRSQKVRNGSTAGTGGAGAGNSTSAGASTSLGDIGGLDEVLDLQVLRALQGKTTVVPVISKADTVTTRHMAHLKQSVWSSLKQARMDLLEALGDVDADDDDDDDHGHGDGDQNIEGVNDDTSGQKRNGMKQGRGNNRNGNDGRSPDEKFHSSPLSSSSSPSPSGPSSTMTSSPLLPLSILSPDDPLTPIYPKGDDYNLVDKYDHVHVHDNGGGERYDDDDDDDGKTKMMEKKEKIIGRLFPWGFADPYDPLHCDFVKLKDAVFVDWRRDLIAATKELWYERWRTERLKRTRTLTGLPSTIADTAIGTSVGAGASAGAGAGAGGAATSNRRLGR